MTLKVVRPDPTLVALRERAKRAGIEDADVATSAELVLELERLREVADETAKRSTATQLVELAEQRYEFGITPGSEVYGVPRAGARVAVLLRGGRSSFRAELARAYYSKERRAASASALADALLAIEGAAHDCDPVDLCTRVGESAGETFLDIGDATGRAIRVGSADWSIVDRAPLLFRRTALTGAISAPGESELDALWTWVRVADADRPLVLAWLVAALMPNIPHPVLVLLGEHGTAKTTSMRMLVGLIDPSPAATRKPPRDAESWVTAAAGSWVVALDNVSSVPDWLSDALCRVVTGEGDVRRRLYADRELEVWAYRRVLMMSAIDLGALRGDLADRMLPVELQPMSPAARKPESAIWPAWAEAQPRVLGGLLDLAVRVLALLPSINVDEMPRMADYGRVLAAVDQVLGTAGVDRYVGRLRSIVSDSASADPLGAAIIANIVTEWRGTAADLLSRLQPDRPPRGWPESPRSVTARLRRLAPGLRAAGWNVTDSGRTGRQHAVEWLLAPPQEMARIDRPHARDARESSNGAGRNAGVSAGVEGVPADARATPALESSNGAGCGDTGDAGANSGASPETIEVEL